jgi:hypothetical protein
MLLRIFALTDERNRAPAANAVIRPRPSDFPLGIPGSRV